MKIVIETLVWENDETLEIPTTIGLLKDDDSNLRIEFENNGRTIQFELAELEEAITTLKKWKEKFKES